jgi:hypothetical protein
MFICSCAKIANALGPALVAQGIRVGLDMLLNDGFTATGNTSGPAVSLRGARVSGQLVCSGASIENSIGSALECDGMRVDEAVFMDDGFHAHGAGKAAVVTFESVQIGGTLTLSLDDTAIKNETCDEVRLSCDGLTYRGVPEGATLERWLTWLGTYAASYASQPYQQLAASHQATGHDVNVRKILMEQRRQQIRSKTLEGRLGRTWARMTGWTLGYGYQPWRALVLLLVVGLVSCTLCAFAGSDSLAPPKALKSTSSECSLIERIAVGLDMGMPLMKLGSRTRCDTADSTTGEHLVVLGWVFQALAWIFATLFVAGFTSAVRKT